MKVEQTQNQISETADYVDEISRGVFSAAYNASQDVGRMPHQIAYGLQMPMTDASTYWQALDNEVSGNHVLDGVREVFGRPTKSESILRKVPDETVERVHTDARELAESTTYEGLREAMTTLARGIEEKGGEEISDEEQEKMQPVSDVARILEGTQEMQEAYDPRR